MLDQFSRSTLVLGEDALDKLNNAHVAVFGIGGVGSYVVEALVRSGVGSIDLIDNDTICLTNLNRQIIALHSSIGKDKVEVMKTRILDINPNCKVKCFKQFYLPENSGNINFIDYDYVVDAIDTVTSKLDIAIKCQALKVNLISCMGTGNKVDPSLLKITDITKTSVCPLAKIMRKECKDRGIKKLKVLYSSEVVRKPTNTQVIKYYEETSKELDNGASKRRSIPGSTSFIPPIAGLMIAGEVIKALIK